MKPYHKKQDNICVRIGHQTKEDLIAIAYANEMNVAEYVRYLIRQAIESNNEVINEQNQLNEMLKQVEHLEDFYYIEKSVIQD